MNGSGLWKQFCVRQEKKLLYETAKNHFARQNPFIWRMSSVLSLGVPGVIVFSALVEVRHLSFRSWLFDIRLIYNRYYLYRKIMTTKACILQFLQKERCQGDIMLNVYANPPHKQWVLSGFGFLAGERIVSLPQSGPTCSGSCRENEKTGLYTLYCNWQNTPGICGLFYYVPSCRKK